MYKQLAVIGITFTVHTSAMNGRMLTAKKVVKLKFSMRKLPRYNIAKIAACTTKMSDAEKIVEAISEAKAKNATASIKVSLLLLVSILILVDCCNSLDSM